jgi:hypothetical protein
MLGLTQSESDEAASFSVDPVRDLLDRPTRTNYEPPASFSVDQIRDLLDRVESLSSTVDALITAKSSTGQTDGIAIETDRALTAVSSNGRGFVFAAISLIGTGYGGPSLPHTFGLTRSHDIDNFYEIAVQLSDTRHLLGLYQHGRTSRVSGIDLFA